MKTYEIHYENGMIDRFEKVERLIIDDPTYIQIAFREGSVVKKAFIK